MGVPYGPGWKGKKVERERAPAPVKKVRDALHNVSLEFYKGLLSFSLSLPPLEEMREKGKKKKRPSPFSVEKRRAEASSSGLAVTLRGLRK